MEKRDGALERLLGGYRRYYTITRFDGAPSPEGRGIREAEKLPAPHFSGGAELSAVCEYYEQTEKYLLIRSAKIWTAAEEEFLFVYSLPHLTVPLWEELVRYTEEAGLSLAHIGPGHMYTYISPIFLADSIDPEAVRLLSKKKIYKTFRFSFHGWMEFHMAALDLTAGRFYFNPAGRCMEKGLKQVLAGYHKEPLRRSIFSGLIPPVVGKVIRSL